MSKNGTSDFPLSPVLWRALPVSADGTPAFQGLKLTSWSPFSLNSISIRIFLGSTLEHLQGYPPLLLCFQGSPSHRGLSSRWRHILLSCLLASTLAEVEASFWSYVRSHPSSVPKTSSSFPSRSESKSSSRQWSARPPPYFISSLIPTPPLSLLSSPTPRASLLYLKTHQAHCS